MKKLLIVMCLLLVGCAPNKLVAWHETRITEITEAKNRGEITEAQYLQLKNDADKTMYDAASRVHAGYLAGRKY